jgi:Icc-related predicted phosphoesterase
MKRFFVCAGLHGNDRVLDGLWQVLRERRPDGILFAGGILSRENSSSATPWVNSSDDTALVQHFLAALGELDFFTALIPGPCDVPLTDFLRLGMQAELDYPNLHIAHENVIALDNLAVCGIGGCLAAEDRAEPDSLNLLRADYFLRNLDRADHPRKIQLLSAAPSSLGGGQHGRLINNLIHSHSADLCVTAGPTEHRGIQRLARTLIVNPGCLADGSAAWVDWRSHPGGHVEFLNLIAKETASEHTVSCSASPPR